MKKSLISICCVLILGGCATTPDVSVSIDAMNDNAKAPQYNYILLPANEELNPRSLGYKEFASYVHGVLANKGFVLAPDHERADAVIFLNYHIGEPKTSQYTYSIPTWGQTGVASSTTYGTLNTYGNTSTYSGTTYNTPSYGITGSTTHIGTTTNFTRTISLNAVDLDEYKKSGEFVQTWYTNAVSVGSSGDLRYIFPIMLAAVEKYISTNTGGYKEILVSPTYIRVSEIKQSITSSK